MYVAGFSRGYNPEKLEEDVLEGLKNSKTLLYLVDNCCEIYFDLLFIGPLIRAFPNLGIKWRMINDAIVGAF
ncbi:ARMT1-like domain-containing protein [Thermococcus sp.]